MGIADKIRTTAEGIKDKAADTLAGAKHKAPGGTTPDAKGGAGSTAVEQGVGENGSTVADTVDLDAPADRVSETRNSTVHSDKLQGL